MNKKLILGMCIVLLVIFTIDINAQSSFDDDSDGVCNWAANSGRYVQVNVHNIGCYADSQYDDMCPGTRETGARRGGINNGCADYQIQVSSNFWSVGLGRYSPDSVKANWLLDQSQGVEFYQEIKLTENPIAGRDIGSINLENVRLTCNSGEGVVLTSAVSIGRKGENIVTGNYKAGETTVYNKGEKSATLKLRLSRLTEDRVGAKLPGSDRNTIDQIRFNCEAIITTNSAQVVDNEQKISISQEVDPFIVVVPISSLAIQPPQQFLDKGIVIAGGIVDFTNKIIPKLEFAYRFSLDKCKWAVKIVLANKFLGIFNSAFDQFAELVWKGPPALRNIGLISDSFAISGRSMCAYSVCPAQWCEFASREVGTKIVPQEKKSSDGKVIINQGTGKPDIEYVPKPETYIDRVNGKIQNSLVLSAACGCISGLAQNLYQLRAIAENWRQCMEIARNTGVYISDCEKVLQKNICDFVVEEYQVFGGDAAAKNLFDKAWKKLTSKFGKNAKDRAAELDKKTESSVREANTAKAETNDAERGVQKSKSFGRELADIGSALGQGSLGYQDATILKTFCSAAIYGKLPDFISDAGVDINRAIISTQVSGNWRTGVAYTNIENKPIYEYEISWMVVAGRDNTRYSTYLRTPEGTKRILDDGNGVIGIQGDFKSDYIQITDTTEYTQLCIEIESDPASSGCYPSGKFATSGVKKDIDLFFGEEDKIIDTDQDRLPDDWEKKYNCYSGRVQYDDEQDKASCDDLLIKLKRFNLLNPNNPDSNGNGVRDDKEDPDGDGWDNHQEYLNGGNPNVAGQKITGELIESSCNANFDSFSVSGGTSENGINYYKPGEVISIKLINDKIYGKTTVSEVVVRTTITGSNVAQVADITLENARRKDVAVWTVPDEADSGTYEIKVEFVKLKDVYGADLCAGIDRKVARSESQILIYNPKTISCLENDGGRDIGTYSVCMDSSGVHKEECTLDSLKEYACKNNKCELDNVQCSGLNSAWTCIPPGLCGQTCFDNDPENEVIFPGSCKDSDNVYNDKCTESGVEQYQCNNLGKCEPVDIKQCTIETSCQTKNLQINLPNLGHDTNGNVGYCVPSAEAELLAVPRPIPSEGVPEIELGAISDGKVREDITNTIKNLKLSGGNGILEIISDNVDAKNANNFNVDYRLILALITVESKGNQSAVSKNSKGEELAYGVLQIYSKAHKKYDKARLKNDIYYNIDAGLEIFYDNLKVATNSPGVYKNGVNKYCSSSKSPALNTKFLGYTGADAALRMYNGFACSCETCGDTFVEKVKRYHKGWIEATTSQTIVVSI